jgi:hypothetical protein
MAHGGRRPGAGRPRGVPSQKTINRLKIAEEAGAAGITPLELMLTNMRSLWEEGTEKSKAAACEIAKDAAPYVHARLATIDQNIKGGAMVVKIIKFADAVGYVEDDPKPAEPVKH